MVFTDALTPIPINTSVANTPHVPPAGDPRPTKQPAVPPNPREPSRDPANKPVPGEPPPIVHDPSHPALPEEPAVGRDVIQALGNGVCLGLLLCLCAHPQALIVVAPPTLCICFFGGFPKVLSRTRRWFPSVVVPAIRSVSGRWWAMFGRSLPD